MTLPYNIGDCIASTRNRFHQVGVISEIHISRKGVVIYTRNKVYYPIHVGIGEYTVTPATKADWDADFITGTEGEIRKCLSTFCI